METMPAPVTPAVRSAQTLPSRADIRQLFTQGDLVPVYRIVLADLETPVSVYIKLAQAGKTSFMLESVEGGEQVGRYSFLGVNPKGLITVRGNQVTKELHGQRTTRVLAPGEHPLLAIKEEFGRVRPVRLEGLPRFVGGAVGFIGYDVVRWFEELPATAGQELDVPDAAFMLPDTLVIFDHVRHRLILLANAHNLGDPAAAWDDANRRLDELAAILAQPLPVGDLPL